VLHADGLVLVVVYYLKPRFTHSAPVRADSDPNASAFSSGSGSSSDTPIPTPSHNTARLDLVIARCCMAIELIPYIVIATNVNSTTFVLMTMLTTFGSPCGPSINSLALSLIPNSSEAGRLFGGLSVLHTIGSSLISPVLFGTLFSYTVGWYAPTVFIVPAVILCIAQVFLALVKLPGSEAGAKTAERGRSRQVKTVRSSSGVVLRRNK
jgi:MFS family permease